jgi:hypothetical protein
MVCEMATRTKRPRGPAAPKAPAKTNAPATPKAPTTPKPSATLRAPDAPEAPAAPETRQARRSVPAALRLAAAAQAIEAVGLFVAGVFAAVSTADGRSSHLGDGIALTAIAFVAAVLLAPIAIGLARARPWSRTPAAMTQLFVIIGGVALLQASRLEWGVPALVLAGACLAGLVTPASLRALNRTDLKTTNLKTTDVKTTDVKTTDLKTTDVKTTDLKRQ